MAKASETRAVKAREAAIAALWRCSATQRARVAAACSPERVDQQPPRKGILITTSTFSREAQDYASFIDSRIILIDGERFVRLMLDHGVRVSTVGVYEVKKIDSDYFIEE